MQMGICHVTFHPGEERREVPASRSGKKPATLTLPVPAWQIANNAQKTLNGKLIGTNVGKQKESVMKVVLDGNGHKARKMMEIELARRRNPPPPPTSVAATATASISSARPKDTLPSLAPATGVTPVVPASTRLPAQTPSASSQPRSQIPLKTEISPPKQVAPRDTPKQFAPRDAPRVPTSSSFSRTGGGGFGVSSTSGWSQSQGYRTVQDIGRLPPVSSSSYNSLRMSSSTSSMSNSYTSFISAPFAKSHPRDSRAPIPPSRGVRDDDSPRYSSSTYQDPLAKSSSMNNDRPLPPSALESYHRRSSRSRRSSVSRTDSEGSDSEDSSDRRRTPSPVYKRGTRRVSDRVPRHAESREEARGIDSAESDQLVSKVKSELMENGRNYITIDSRSLPIPHKLEDRERIVEDLKGHLKAVKIEKVCSSPICLLSMLTNMS
jgi:hypothetical protein